TEVSFMRIGYDFLKTMNITLMDGKDFSKDIQSDVKAYLINEKAAELLGMKNPVGKTIKSVNGEGNIIGVMKDFHLKSIHTTITPLILCLGPQFTQTHIFVKPQIGHLEEALADLENLLKKFTPTYPCEYHFLDDDYERLYKDEIVVKHVIIYFGVLAVLISCLGLLSLVSFTAEKRYKEIGIRKVFGASFADIIATLTQDFVKLVFISIIISIPFAWYATDLWLQSFSYKIEIQEWMFLVPGIITILIVMLTVSYQTIKAALMNPVKSLKSE
ncbi:MAG: FtsX-like permease family protein, partial [Bacteroidota bacterium]